MPKKKPTVTADRRDDILSMQNDERRIIIQLDELIVRTTLELKEAKSERSFRAEKVLSLVDEMGFPEQVCTACGVVRAILETVWEKHNACPSCRAKAEGGV